MNMTKKLPNRAKDKKRPAKVPVPAHGDDRHTQLPKKKKEYPKRATPVTHPFETTLDF